MRVERKISKIWTKFLDNSGGQTAVEYILMLLVVAVLATTIGKRVKLLMFGAGDCPNQSTMCKIIGIFQGDGFMNGNFRYFTLKR